MTDTNKSCNGTSGEKVNPFLGQGVPEKAPKGCFIASGVFVGLPVFIVWVKFVTVLLHWTLG